VRSFRVIVKLILRLVALACASPFIASYYLKALVIGFDRSLEGSTQMLSLVPGLPGRYLRVAFLRCALAHCDASAAVEFGTLFSQAMARIGPNVYIGPRCQIGWADIGADVLIASGVHIPSGADIHGTADLDVPIREQEGAPRVVRIGANSWIGSAAVVMADVGEQSVVGAGSVVTRPLPARVMAAGVPAKVIRERTAAIRPSTGELEQS
jgi:acetyltransferase-like isoleucine patch superfamily enzyme